MMHAGFATTTGVLNIVMYVPLGFFGVLAFRRPLLNLVACVNLTVATELFQGLMANGRGCDGSDMITNSTGALIGTALALGWLGVNGQVPRVTQREARRSAILFSCGLAILFTVLISTLRIVGLGERVTHTPMEVARLTGVRLFGPDVHVSTATLAPDQHSVTATSDQGTFTISWPTYRLLSYESSDRRADPGNMSDDELGQQGRAFVEKWWPYAIKGATQSLQPIADGVPGMVFSYRRFRDGVLMPLRIDVTLTAAGRVISATAVSATDEDPEGIPEPTVSMDEAKQDAVKAHPGTQATNAFLLAKTVDHQWHTLWAVSLTGARQFGVFVDAVSGEIVIPDGS